MPEVAILEAIPDQTSFFGLSMLHEVMSEDLPVKIIIPEEIQSYAQFLAFHIAWIITGCTEDYPLFHEPENLCYDVCPDGFYGDVNTSYICEPCTQPCASCMNSFTNCSSCFKGRMALVDS